MHEHGSLRLARRDGLIEETLGEELLLYDQNRHTAHCLSPIAASVWRHCDGERDMTELAELTGASESLVADALHELRKRDLLDAEPTLVQSPGPGISRREAVGKIVGYGATAVAAPLVVSATAATPAMAASTKCTGCGEVDTEKLCCCCKDGVCIEEADTVTNCEGACAKHEGVRVESHEHKC